MAKSKLKDIVSRNIRAFRIEAGLTQQVIADRAGFQVSYFARLESNPQNISLEVLERIAQALGRSVAEVVTEEGLAGIPRKSIDLFSEGMRLLRVFEAKIYPN